MFKLNSLHKNLNNDVLMVHHRYEEAENYKDVTNMLNFSVVFYAFIVKIY